MRRILKRRPSPSMVVAFIALIAALSGTAVALPGVNLIDSGDIKNGQVKGKDIGKNAVTGKKVKNGSLTGADVKDKSLTASDFSGSVQGPKGDKGDTGATGATGPAGSAAAYALVDDLGDVVSAQAKNITSANVTHPIIGTYCFSGLSFAPTNVLATINGNTGNGAGDAQASIFLPGEDPTTAAGCPAGAQAVVYTINNDNPGTLDDFAFYVAFN
jgi:hypothetical protein